MIFETTNTKVSNVSTEPKVWVYIMGTINTELETRLLGYRWRLNRQVEAMITHDCKHSVAYMVTEDEDECEEQKRRRIREMRRI